MSYQQTIADILAKAIASAGVDVSTLGDLTPSIEVPKDLKMGDFAFPCFRLARAMRKAPPMIANELLPALKEAIAEEADLSDVVAAGPYLNFKVNKTALAASLIPSILDGSFLAAREALGEKVMIEYSQPNTHKAFHVGHTRNVALGDALVRIYEWCGHEVIAANYIGDEGTHIAKCLWFYREHFDGQVPDTNLGEFLGGLYAQASIMLDFKTLTKCPMPHVSIARVVGISPIDGQEKVKRVTVDTGSSQVEVICGGTKYAEGDLVAYAGEGARVGGRLVGTVEKYGISSTGMILSYLELGLGEEKDPIYCFPADAPLGQDVAEYFRIPGALPDNRSVLNEMALRTQGVADVLKRLEAKEPEIEALWQKTRKWSMDEFHLIYDWLEARFDHYFFESEVGDTGKKICQDYYEKGVLVESEGAIGADLTDSKLPFLILIKSDGSGLYSTKDIALAKDKFDNFGIDRSIYVVDASQSLHFQQVFKTLEKMGYKRARNCYHLAYGVVKLPEGKMGSRHGNVILFSQLRDSLIGRITEEYLDQFRGDWSDEEISEAARRIAIATIRYGMTNQDNGKDIIFDLNEWISATGNTGTYMMYAYTRTRSLLRKAGEYDLSGADWSLLTDKYEISLLQKLGELPKVAYRARDENRPQLICIYLYDLARAFSRFYDNCPVLSAETEALKLARLPLVEAGSRVLKQGMALLGIQTLERM